MLSGSVAQLKKGKQWKGIHQKPPGFERPGQSSNQVTPAPYKVETVHFPVQWTLGLVIAVFTVRLTEEAHTMSLTPVIWMISSTFPKHFKILRLRMRSKDNCHVQVH